LLVRLLLLLLWRLIFALLLYGLDVVHFEVVLVLVLGHVQARVDDLRYGLDFGSQLLLNLVQGHSIFKKNTCSLINFSDFEGKKYT
jgi:hypothetical protein